MDNDNRYVKVAKVLCDSGEDNIVDPPGGAGVTLGDIADVGSSMLDGACLTNVVVVKGDDGKFYVGEFMFVVEEVTEDEARRVVHDFNVEDEDDEEHDVECDTPFSVWNDTDHISASSTCFATCEDAEAFIPIFRRRFAAQGYYLTAAGERIASEDVKLRVVGPRPKEDS